jgi:hypothetical protein
VNTLSLIGFFARAGGIGARYFYRTFFFLPIKGIIKETEEVCRKA